MYKSKTAELTDDEESLLRVHIEHANGFGISTASLQDIMSKTGFEEYYVIFIEKKLVAKGNMEVFGKLDSRKDRVPSSTVYRIMIPMFL